MEGGILCSVFVIDNRWVILLAYVRCWYIEGYVPDYGSHSEDRLHLGVGVRQVVAQHAPNTVVRRLGGYGVELTLRSGREDGLFDILTWSEPGRYNRDVSFLSSSSIAFCNI